MALSRDNAAFTILTLNVKDSQIIHIQECTSAKEAWGALRTVHQGIGASGRMVLIQEIVRITAVGRGGYGGSSEQVSGVSKSSAGFVRKWKKHGRERVSYLIELESSRIVRANYYGTSISYGGFDF